MLIGFAQQVYKFEICRGKSGHRTTLSFRTSAHAGVGISVEFRAAYRHTDRSFCFVSPNMPVCYRKMVFLSGRLPHQSEDWFAMTRIMRSRSSKDGDCHASVRTGSQWHGIRVRNDREFDGARFDNHLFNPPRSGTLIIHYSLFIIHFSLTLVRGQSV